MWPHYLRELTASSARNVLRLCRVARRLCDMPHNVPDCEHMSVSDVGEMLWEVIARRDDGLRGSQTVWLALRLADGRPQPIDLPPVPDLPDLPDQRPGCYYVSAREPGRDWLVAGPYATHGEALLLREAVQRHAGERDARAFWMAWGTARTDDPAETLLGPWRPPEARPEAPQPEKRKHRNKASKTIAAYERGVVR